MNLTELITRLRSRTVSSWVRCSDGALRMSGHKPDPDCQAAADELERLRKATLAAPQPEPVGEVVIGEEGMTKGWTVIKWRADLPPIAVGTKLYAECPQWISRFHHLMKKHGLHPGRTDDDLLDILDAHLSASQPQRAPLTSEQRDEMWRAAWREDSYRPGSYDWYEAGVRDAERAHGIGHE